MKKTPASPASAQPGRDENTVEMFPELLPQKPARPPALSPAERQRRAREKKKGLRESVGLKEVALRQDEREALAEAVMLLEITAPGLDLEACQALLQKLTPGARWIDDDVVDKSWRACSMPPQGWDTEVLPLDHTLHLNRFDMGLLWCAMDVMETARSDLKHRESSLVWGSLERIFGGSTLGFDWKNGLGSDSAILIRRKRDRVDAQRGWKSYEEERGISNRLRAELNGARAEIKHLQQTLDQIAQELTVPIESVALVQDAAQRISK